MNLNLARNVIRDRKVGLLLKIFFSGDKISNVI